VAKQDFGRIKRIADRLWQEIGLKADVTGLSGKQDVLVPGANLKTINSESLLGVGNIEITGGGNAGGVSLGETETTAYRGDRGKAAYDKSHTQGTDQGLDTGGANAVTAAQAKAGYTHSQATHAPSNADNTLSYIGGIDVGDIEVEGAYLLMFDSNDEFIKKFTLGDLEKHFDTIYQKI
jgi:hypothetical protein